MPPTESLVGELKSTVLAGGWIPFSIVVVLLFIFSFMYVRYYQHKREKELGPTVVAILGLFFALLTTALIPVDIFLVSSYKASDGTFHDWATEDIRSQINKTLTDGYYTMYGLICAFIFFFMPMAYFFFEEKDEVAQVSTKLRLFRAFKFTLGTLVVMGVLMCIGAFALNSDGSTCSSTTVPGNATSPSVRDWAECRAQFAESSFTKNSGTNAISFTVGVLAVIGMGYFVFYTALGLVALPLDLMRARARSSDMDLGETSRRTRVARDKQDSIRAKYAGKSKRMSDRDRDELADQEEEERVLTRAQQDLEERDSKCIGKVARVCKPFSFVIGLALMLLSAFVVIALLLTCVDRLMQINSQHLNYKTGYTQATPKIINPVDKLLSMLQLAFPMDYIALTLLVFFFVLATAAGIVHAGVRFCFMKVFTVRAGKTVPQGLLCLVAILMFTVLALNIVLLTLSPQYSTYGNQHYPAPPAQQPFAAWPGSASLCDSQAPQYIFYAFNASGKFLTASDYSTSTGACSPGTVFNDVTKETLDLSGMGCARMEACVATRLSALLHAFFFNAWFFGAIYYWANWLHILVFFAGAVLLLVRKRKSAIEVLIQDHKTNFDEDDDDLVPFNPSWMK